MGKEGALGLALCLNSFTFTLTPFIFSFDPSLWELVPQSHSFPFQLRPLSNPTHVINSFTLINDVAMMGPTDGLST